MLFQFDISHFSVLLFMLRCYLFCLYKEGAGKVYFSVLHLVLLITKFITLFT
jgi:hypothetical protein